MQHLDDPDLIELTAQRNEQALGELYDRYHRLMFSVAINVVGSHEEGLSNCYEQCAANWPPLLVQPGEAPVSGAGITGELGVAERDDGSLQVIYDGKPLYYWVNDEAPGDTTGQGVNDVWFVVAP
jgi:predicted lipoprotein with Yx(FWY)xxD motif